MFSRRDQIEIKTPEQLQSMRTAGLVVADALAAVAAAMRPGLTTADLDAVAADVITSAGASPSFLGYHGFPATICTSVNDEIVHGIPGGRVIADGDLVSIDRELDDAVERPATVNEERVEHVDLGRVARITVQHEAAADVIGAEPVADHGIGDRVRDELPRVEVRLGRHAEGRAPETLARKRSPVEM